MSYRGLGRVDVATGQTYMPLLSLMTAFIVQLVVIKCGNILCVCVPVCVTFFSKFRCMHLLS